jgi:hypothetical protein
MPVNSRGCPVLNTPKTKNLNHRLQINTRQLRLSFFPLYFMRMAQDVMLVLASGTPAVPILSVQPSPAAGGVPNPFAAQ